MKIFLSSLLLLSYATYVVFADGKQEISRKDKVLGIFNVVKFPNSNCTLSGTTDKNNGTCYTSDECSSLGGKARGSCYSGYGVCCEFTKSCNQTSYENSTYLDSGESVSTGSCSYRLCPKTSKICRMRFDFITFSLAVPSAPSTIDVSTGDCTIDSFSISAPGSRGSPVICGVNTNQHMILDVGNDCLTASFFITQTTSRWNILVRQYNCGTEWAGPAGCLQYFNDKSATIKSFNYDATTPIHLSNQNYDICIGRQGTATTICYGGAAISNILQLSFTGDTDCSIDYILIHGGVSASGKVGDLGRNCGAALTNAAVTEATATTSVCTTLTPFRVTFVTDGGEDVGAAVDGTDGTASGGFSLTYNQY